MCSCLRGRCNCTNRFCVQMPSCTMLLHKSLSCADAFMHDTVFFRAKANVHNGACHRGCRRRPVAGAATGACRRGLSPQRLPQGPAAGACRRGLSQGPVTAEAAAGACRRGCRRVPVAVCLSQGLPQGPAAEAFAEAAAGATTGPPRTESIVKNQ